MNLRLGFLLIAIFCAGLYCSSEFLIPKKASKKGINNQQLMHRLELLMRTWSRVLAQLGVVQEYSIVAIGALLEHDKSHPLVVQKANRKPFIDRVRRLTNLSSALDQELESFCMFLKQMKDETKKSSRKNA